MHSRAWAAGGDGAEGAVAASLRCGADETVQGGAQGGEGGEAGERPHQAAPVCAGPGHLRGGLSEHHVPLGGGGTPGQEEAGAYHPCHAATVSVLLDGQWAPSCERALFAGVSVRQAEGWVRFPLTSQSVGLRSHTSFFCLGRMVVPLRDGVTRLENSGSQVM